MHDKSSLGFGRRDFFGHAYARISSVVILAQASRSGRHQCAKSSSMSSSASASSGGSGADASNDKLIEWLDMLAWTGARFTKIWTYKTSLELCSIAQHQGTIIEISLPDQSQRPRFIKLDYGQDGLHYQTSEDFPQIPNQLPWDSENMFQTAHISEENADPNVLVHLIRSVRGIRYHLLEWNCIQFAQLVWRSFVYRRQSVRTFQNVPFAAY